MSATEQLPPSSPRLVAVAGHREGEVFELDGNPFTIGRQSSNDLRLSEASVSRQHCHLVPADEHHELIDLGSRCGTFVNGIPVRRKVLANGDFLKIGGSLFLYLLPDKKPEAEVDAAHLLDDGQQIESTLELSIDEASNPPGGRLESWDRTAHHLAALLRLSRGIQDARGTENLLTILSEQVFEILPAERLAVLLNQDGETVLAHEATRGGEKTSGPISGTLIERAMTQRVAILSNNIAHDPDLAHIESLDASEIGGVLCVPLLTRDASLGILYADAPQDSSPFDRDHLKLMTAVAGIASLAVQQAQRTDWLEAENRRLRDAELEHDIVGESAALERVLGHVARVASTDLSVLLLGESGTGKELFAKAIHRNSPRVDRPFIAINCATLSETLLESELFGHEKGAFTGAVGRKIGQFELAHEGTLFLDEVGEIPVALQARLLRALEAREIRRVGGQRTIPIDVRLVAATNRDLKRAIAEGTFRDDLYHRLDIFSIQLPPLRERSEDIALLANHFAARTARRLSRPLAGLSAAAREAIVAYDWPGNVRELQNAMERAVVLASDEWLRPEDLPDAILEHAASSDESPLPGTYHEAVTEAKRRILLQAMDDAGGNYSEAAKRLGLNRTYLHRLISNLKLRA